MGSRASTMDLREYLAYLDHLRLVPTRITRSTAVGIFTAVNKGNKSAASPKLTERAVSEMMDKDVHDDDAHELSFDEFFECMRRVAVRLAVTDCDLGTYDRINAQLGEHKPVYFGTIDNDDYAQVLPSPTLPPLPSLLHLPSLASPFAVSLPTTPRSSTLTRACGQQAVPAYNFDTETRAWIRTATSPVIHIPERSFISPVISPQNLGLHVNSISPSITPSVSLSQSFESTISRMRSSTSASHADSVSVSPAFTRSPALKGTWDRSATAGHSQTPPLRIYKDLEASGMHRVYSRSFESASKNGLEASMEKRLVEGLMMRRLSGSSQSPVLMHRLANERVMQRSSFEANSSVHRTSSLDSPGGQASRGNLKSRSFELSHRTSGAVSHPHSPAAAPSKAGGNPSPIVAPSKSGANYASPMLPRLPSMQVARIESGMSIDSNGSPIMASESQTRRRSLQEPEQHSFEHAGCRGLDQGQPGSKDSILHWPPRSTLKPDVQVDPRLSHGATRRASGNRDLSRLQFGPDDEAALTGEGGVFHLPTCSLSG